MGRMKPNPEMDTIYVGDCLKRMRAWADDQFDLIFADPPYNIGYAYDTYDDDQPVPVYRDWTEAWLLQCSRLLRPGGALFVLIGDEHAHWVRWVIEQEEKRLRLQHKDWIIWRYTFGQNARTKYTRSHAHLFWSVDCRAEFTFNAKAIGVPSWRSKNGDPRAAGSTKTPDDVWDDFPRLVGNAKEREGWHPCQLPESLMERCIRGHTNPGDLVFDPFVGSATTLRVAAKTGRHWVGTELDPGYAKAARKRVRRARKRHPD